MDLEKKKSPEYENEVSSVLHYLVVWFTPKSECYKIAARGDSTIGDVIANICKQANYSAPENCDLWYQSKHLLLNKTVLETGLHQASMSPKDLPTIRLKLTSQIKTSPNIGKTIVLVSPENILYHEILDIQLPSNRENIFPEILQPVIKQIVERSSWDARNLSNGIDTILVPLPIFTEQLINALPTINLTLPFKPMEFDWNAFLKCLANDLEVEHTDLVVVSAEEGSTKLKVKLRPTDSVRTRISEIERKLVFLVLPNSQQFVTDHDTLNGSSISSWTNVVVELENLSNNSHIPLLTADIECALRFSERPAIINETAWTFLVNKSRQIRTCILHALQRDQDECIIDHAALIFNEHLFENYRAWSASENDNERILFHGTNIDNFDSILESNFQNYIGPQRTTDSGWYGRGIYFSSSPSYVRKYARRQSGSTLYLICSLVKLGQTLTVTDSSYDGREMNPDFHSHYVRVTESGHPVTDEAMSFYEEFVIKESNQILPLFIICLRQVERCVIWRDAQVANAANSAVYAEMSQRYPFNIYGCETTSDAISTLTSKLTNCTIVTNGADNGEEFVRECRQLRSTIPIVVYCMRKDLHDQWATTLEGPAIKVTTNSNDVYQFIDNT